MTRRKLSPRTLGALVAGGLAVYLLVGFFALVAPKRGEAGELAARIERTELQLAQAKAGASADPAPVAQTLRTADVFRLAKAMPSAVDMPGILLELSDLAEGTGISFEAISPQPAAAFEAYQAVPVSVVFRGSFHELSEFLYRLRTLVAVRNGGLDARGRLFSVESVDFAQAPGGFPELEAKLVVNAYTYGKGAPATGAAPLPQEAPPVPDASTSAGEAAPAAGANG